VFFFARPKKASALAPDDVGAPGQGNASEEITLDGQGLFAMSVVLSFTVIGLLQFLYTAPAQFQEAPGSSVLLWATNSLIALPLFALGIWGGHWIATRRGIGMSRRADLVRRALLTAAILAVVLAPAWFAHNWLDKLTQAEPLVPVHVHGKTIGANLHWVSDPVVLALILVPALALAGWGGYLIATRVRLPLPRAADITARAAMIAAGVAAVPAAGWFLQKAADRSNSAQVYNTSALLSVHVHTHVRLKDGRLLPLPKGPPVTSAPYAFAYQVAHAFQDALVGMAIGLPVAFIALFWIARRLRARDLQASNQQVPVLSLREATEQ
jgi:hypothetical protein